MRLAGSVVGIKDNTCGNRQPPAKHSAPEVLGSGADGLDHRRCQSWSQIARVAVCSLSTVLLVLSDAKTCKCGYGELFAGKNKTDGDSDGDGVSVMMAVIVGLLGVDGDEH